MASAPERVDPTFGDALAGDGGMTDPVTAGALRDRFDVFPDALSSMPLPASTFVMSPVVGAPAAASARPGAVRPGSVQPAPVRQRAVQSGAVQPPPIAVAPPYSRPPALPRQGRPVPPATSARGVVAPSSGRRPVAGVGYVAPTATSGGVVRPPAYLPQNQGVAQLRAAVRQARAGRPSWASPSAVRPAPPTGARRSRASSIWGLFVFVVILLISTGIGQQIVHAVTELLHRR